MAIKDLEPIKVRYTSRRSQLESAPRLSRSIHDSSKQLLVDPKDPKIPTSLGLQFAEASTLDTKVGMFLLLLGTFLVPYVSLLQPLGDAMMAVKWEMCGGNQTFVVGESLGQCLCV